MSYYHQTKTRSKFLFVNGVSEQAVVAAQKYSKQHSKPVEIVLLLDSKKTAKQWQIDHPEITTLSVDFNDPIQLQDVLKSISEEVIAATCLGDGNVPLLKKVIPHLPNCDLPTETSLDWTTEKIKMRELLRNYDKTIAPKFLVAHDATLATIEKIEKRVGYPLVVKPSGLAASLLVSICYHREELEKVLTHTIKKIGQIYKLKRGRGEPVVLVEQFMEGSMYSIDAYVNGKGVIYFAPTVYVETGRNVGFDDFFGYMRMTPTQLNGPHTEEAQEAAMKAVKALGMRSTSCHIELMRTEEGWKVIELGPRIGGFRHEMYELAFGIDHSLNDLLIRIPEKPMLPKKVRGFTAVLQFYAKNEGKLEKIKGIMKVQALASLSRINVRKVPGDKCLFAKNGGDPVLEIVLFNAKRSDLLADKRRIEQHLEIITVK